MAEPVLLAVRDVRKAFGGVTAVAGVSFRLRQGEVRALIGPNGAGKTTLFNVLTGQLRPDAGTVLFREEAIQGAPPARIWRRGVSRTFQVPATFQSFSVLENVQAALLSWRGLAWRFLTQASAIGRAEALGLLEEVGLDGQASRPSRVLPVADLKRLELAVALANAPTLLLLDEPTAGMGRAERSGLMTLVGRLVRERGLTVLFTEHDMDVVFEYADRIMVLHQGRLIAEGTPEAIRQDREVQAVYLGGAGCKLSKAGTPGHDRGT